MGRVDDGAARTAAVAVAAVFVARSGADGRNGGRGRWRIMAWSGRIRAHLEEQLPMRRRRLGGRTTGAAVAFLDQTVARAVSPSQRRWTEIKAGYGAGDGWDKQEYGPRTEMRFARCWMSSPPRMSVHLTQSPLRLQIYVQLRRTRYRTITATRWASVIVVLVPCLSASRCLLY